MRPGQSQAFLSVAQCWDKRQCAQTGAQEVPCEHQEAILCCVCVSAGTGCPERLWNFLLGAFQKLPGCGPGYPCLRIPLLGQSVGPDNWPPKVPHNLILLWFCGEDLLADTSASEYTGDSMFSLFRSVSAEIIGILEPKPCFPSWAILQVFSLHLRVTRTQFNGLQKLV